MIAFITKREYSFDAPCLELSLNLVQAMCMIVWYNLCFDAPCLELSLNSLYFKHYHDDKHYSFDAPCLELSLNYNLSAILNLIIEDGFDAPCLELSLNAMVKLYEKQERKKFRCSLFGAFFKYYPFKIQLQGFFYS